MGQIDPTARVEDGARVAPDVEIGPFCVIGKDVTIGSGCRLISHVNVVGRTTVGAGSVIYPFASLGTAPQSLAYRGEPTALEIGDNCTIRESVTMNIGTVGGGGLTRVGSRGYFMAYSHVGHDCRRKFTRERLHKVRSFYQALFHGPGAFAERLVALQGARETDPAICEILDFLGDDAKRSLVLPKQSGGRPSLEA
jgi:acyl-[acyl carrier protein]--UDP-N-acetylglucosamine O-acyltransferase